MCFTCSIVLSKEILANIIYLNDLQVIESDGPVVQALQARRQVILDNIRDNDELGVSYQKVVPLIVACAFWFCSLLS